MDSLSGTQHCVAIIRSLVNEQGSYLSQSLDLGRKNNAEIGLGSRRKCINGVLEVCSKR